MLRCPSCGDLPCTGVEPSASEGVYTGECVCTFICTDPVIYRRFVHELFGLGVYASPALLLHMIVSTAHTDADIDAAVETAHTAAARL